MIMNKFKNTVTFTGSIEKVVTLELNSDYISLGDCSLTEPCNFIKRNNYDTFYDFTVIQTNFDCDSETFLITESNIDITDSWIDIEGIKETCDIDRSQFMTTEDYEISLANDIVFYHGAYHCNGTIINDLSELDMTRILIDMKILNIVE